MPTDRPHKHRTPTHLPANARREGRGQSGRITAVLGPTNTGKTHFAIERMLAHRSGMIGLPLRLLAREVYDKVIRLKPAADVALITGEERIVPAHPRYFVCTVEAMPVDIPVAFLAIDEIQLCADLERGHVFTDRLLHARGEEETMFMGAATMRGAIQRFAPQTHFITRPRFSDLAYTGARKLTRLPRRSAVVAFSAEDVYGIADLVRQQRGGAAVVMGALSPRTRNAQVALYQSGEVDFMVATDAIGMGINMDVDHVAFAAREKFDGVMVRPLRADEIGQIAGRAGRFMNDGTFGVTADTEPLDADLVAQVENHRYDPVRVLQWRNTALQFTSLDTLLETLDAPPPTKGLVRARPASDLATLRMLRQDDEIRDMACAPAAIRKLWETCQLPDFRKLSADEHASLVGQIFRYLMAPEGVIPDDWLARQISYLDVVDGEVDTLSARLAQIRTWTYAAHRPSWTQDPAHWQAQTRAVEDRLSDALHERLTQRFMDRRTSALMRHLRDEEFLALKLDDSGDVALGDEHIGKLDGFRFAPDPRAEGMHGRTLRAAALKGLEGEFVARARKLNDATDSEITLSEHGQIWWNGAVVARLRAGAHVLAPEVHLAADDVLSASAREGVQQRLNNWMHAHVGRLLAPLLRLRDAAEARDTKLPGLARGIAYQLTEAGGTLDRATATLPEDIRAAESALHPLGVRIGKHSIFLPVLLKPAPASLAALLCALHAKLDPIPAPPLPGLTSFELDDELPQQFLAAAGFRAIGKRAVRLDILERLESNFAQSVRMKLDADVLQKEAASLLGCSNEDATRFAAELGYIKVARKGDTAKKDDAAAEASEPSYIWINPSGHQNARSPKRKNKNRNTQPTDAASPFASLAALISD